MSKITEGGTLKNSYSNFIATSRYARWLDDKNRRETWEETVTRYVDYMRSHSTLSYSDPIFDELHSAILNHEIMPSMRALMTAGPALERDNIAAYNCSFIAVDSLRAFDEAMYILMNGTGVGFSVEEKHVSKLPVIADDFYDTNTTIVVEDSKLGWAKAFKELLPLLVTGQVPKWDMSKVRPAGARLKTFGGRASGPEPLDSLFHFSVELFKGAAGRKLKSLEAHDLMTKVAEVIVVGGVRRSALISQSDLDDFGMATAKSGKWWENYGHRALANNSAVYNAKPTTGQFLKEWTNLYDSKSGERGIFNLDSVRKHVDSFGRRDSSKIAGTNPCFSADTLLLTDKGWVSFGDAYKSGASQNIIQDGRITYVPSSDGVEHPENWKVSNKAARGVVTNASEVFLTQKNAAIVKMVTGNGQTIRLTPDHLVATPDGMVAAGELHAGDKVLVTAAPLPSDPAGEPGTVEEIEAFLMGMIAGDGTFSDGKTTQIAHIDLWGEYRHIQSKITDMLDVLWDTFGDSDGRPFTKYSVTNDELRNKVRITSSFLAAHLKSKYGFEKATKHNVPDQLIAEARSSAARQYVAALAFCDGTVNRYSKVGSSSIRIAQSNYQMLSDVNKILLANGIVSPLYLRKEASTSILPDGRGGVAEYNTKAHYEIVVVQHTYEFTKYVGFGFGHKKKLAEFLFDKPSRKENTYTKVVSIEDDGFEDVYCLKEDLRRTLTAGGVAMRRCGEILLRPNQFCNLTEVVISPDDTKASIVRKVELATILGTWQSSLTDFKYIRKAWKVNSEEERLLGVSFTGIFGNEFMSTPSQELAEFLDAAREHAVQINAVYAEKFGINPSAAITCVKPSGTVSQLTVVSSGIHPWYSPYYLRTVRADNKDPLTQLMKDEGLPWEPDVMKPDATSVFYFPIRAPKGVKYTKDLTAIEHLEIWKMYREHWTEHNPSVTINVREDEWVGVGAWVYDNFDNIGGVSFLPSSEHTYKQAPYQAVSEEEFAEWEAKMPSSVNWSLLPLYETEDGTSGSQELACVSGEGCEVVDLV